MKERDLKLAWISRSDVWALAILVVLAIVSQTSLMLHLDPLVFPDTASYMHLADNIRSCEWTDFYFRTPGYPVFLAMIQWIFGSDDAIYPAAVQVVLSGFVPLLIYGIFRSVSGSVLIGFVAGLVYFVDWSGQAMSVAVLTESLTQLLLLVSVLLGVLLCRQISVTKTVILAVAIFCLTMVRPAFFPCAPCMAAILFVLEWRRKSLSRKKVLAISAVALIPMLLTAVWALEVKRETGTYTISHITGVALFNQVSSQVVNVHDFEDKKILDTLQREVAAGNGSNAGWVVIAEAAKDGKAAEWQAADKIKALSVRLILSYPTIYIHKVLQNSREFWVDSATYVFSDSETSKWMDENPFWMNIKKWSNELFWLRPGRILFLLAMVSLATVALLCLPMDPREQKAGVAVIASSILICMLAHTMINGADLARYRMPIQTLCLAYVVYLFCLGIRIIAYKLKERIC